MATTLETRDAIVSGGPCDGLRMQVRIRDDGTVELANGAVFLGDTADMQYVFNSATGTIDYVPSARGRSHP